MSLARHALPYLLVAVALGACNSSGPPAVSAGLASPVGSGCAAEIGSFQGVLDNDLATGHLNKSIHDRATGDLGRASAACLAGRNGDAIQLVAAAKARYGY